MCFDQKFHKPFDVSRFARFYSFQTQNVHRSKIVFLLGKKFTGKRIIEKGGGKKKYLKTKKTKTVLSCKKGLFRETKERFLEGIFLNR